MHQPRPGQLRQLRRDVSLYLGYLGKGKHTSSGLSRRAGIKSSLVSLALGVKLLADEVRDDLDVQCRSVVEVGVVDSLERSFLASVKADGELNSWVGAGAEVKSLTLGLLCGGLSSGIALLLLVTALSDTSIEGSGVGSVGASIVLDGARSLESSTDVDEGGTVDGEWAVAR